MEKYLQFLTGNNSNNSNTNDNNNNSNKYNNVIIITTATGINTHTHASAYVHTYINMHAIYLWKNVNLLLFCAAGIFTIWWNRMSHVPCAMQCNNNNDNNISFNVTATTNLFVHTAHAKGIQHTNATTKKNKTNVCKHSNLFECCCS